MHQLLAFLKPYFLPGVQRRRLLLALFGVLICAFGVSLCRMADFGVDPFQTLCSGLYNVIPLPQGLIYVGIDLALLVVVLLLNKHYIGLGTMINLFLLGYVVDFCERGLKVLFGMPTLAGRIIYLLTGILVLCVSCAMYITADLGVSTYDGITLHLVDKKIAPYRVMRIITDLICVGLGVLMGGPAGVCTLVTALLLGPAIAYFRAHWFEPLLKQEAAK